MFTEFLDMAEARYPPAFLEDLIDAAHEPTCFSMINRSGDLREGLIIGCLKQFNETAEIVREDLQSGPSTRDRFKIFRSGG